MASTERRDVLLTELAVEQCTILEKSRPKRTIHSFLWNHVPQHFGGIVVRDLSTADVVAYLQGLELSGYWHSTRRRLHSHLVSLLDFGVASGAADINVARSIPRHAVPKAEPFDPLKPSLEVLSFDEMRLMITSPVIPFYRRLFWALALLTGARFGEVAELRWSDYAADLEPFGGLSYTRSWECRGRFVKETKTGRGRRAPVIPVLASVLDEARTWGEQVRRRPVQPDDLIAAYPHRTGLRHWHSYTALRMWRDDLAKLGIKDPPSGPRRLHSARHSFVSIAVSRGGDERTIAAISHLPEKGRTSFEIYKHYSWSALCRAVSVLDWSGIDR